jgi:ribosomal protein S21
MSRRANIVVHVNGNVERAIRQLKKKSEREQITRDMKRKAYHEPKTQKRRKQLMRAMKRNALDSMTNSAHTSR